MHLLLSLPWYVLGTVVISLFILLAISGLALVRRFTPPGILKENQTAAAAAFNIIGVLYAVLLGFTVLNVQSRFQSVSQAADAEAGLVEDLFRSAQEFPLEDAAKIRSLLHQYVYSVIEFEWSTMADGNYHLDTSRIAHDLWRAYQESADPTTEKQKIWYTVSVNRLNELSNYRASRVFNSRESLGPMMWALLLLGAVIVTCFFYFFWMEPFSLQIIITSMLAGNVAFMLFLTFVLDNPFVGDRSIQPTALESVLETFRHWEQGYSY